mgnify:CR=1 FL=1
MNFSLNTNREDLSLMQSTIAKFCEAEIAPEYDKWENEGIFPRDLWNKLGQAFMNWQSKPGVEKGSQLGGGYSVH